MDRAVSIRQPYGFAILHLGKRLENRERSDGRIPALCRHRGPILIHSSSWFGLQEVHDQTEDCIAIAERNGLDIAARRPITLRNLKGSTGGIIGRCRVVGAVGFACDDPLRLPEDQQRWYTGAHAAVLADVEAFTEVIPCRGMLGVFRVPPAVAEAAARAEVLR